MGNNNQVIVKQIKSESERNIAYEIRRIVFVEEQRVDEQEEYDEFEDSSIHYLATINNVPVGVCRWRRTDKGIKLERFAVLKEYRSDGVGSALVSKVLEDVPTDGGKIYMHAQISAMGLYSKFGFKVVGDEFEEAGIKHFKMEKVSEK